MVKEHYNVILELDNFTKKKLKRVGGSQLVEDGICRARREEGENNARIMKPERMMSTLLDKQVLGKVHRYKEVHLSIIKRICQL